MRVFKNLFGDNSKIHASNIVSGDSNLNFPINGLVDTPANYPLPSWVAENAPANQWMYFNVHPTAQNLPPSGNEWKYGTGLAMKRYNSQLVIILFSTTGRIAIRNSNLQTGSWTDWRVI